MRKGAKTKGLHKTNQSLTLTGRKLKQGVIIMGAIVSETEGIKEISATDKGALKNFVALIQWKVWPGSDCQAHA